MDDFLMGLRLGRRLDPIQKSLSGKITNQEGAELAGLSVRQFRRLKQRVKLQGEAGLKHGNRGRPSKRRISKRLRKRILFWLQRKDVRVNDCHIVEKLQELEALEVSRETVRRVRRTEGIAPKRRRRPRAHRRRREREARCGAMMLVDGSPFRWLDDAGPQLDLVGAMDDATGKILSLVLRPHEDLHGYAQVFAEVFASYGLPERVYGDRTTVLVRSDDHWSLEEQLAGRQHPTQLGQALEDLGITYIAAQSPQAKGRIERLWSTLQDRLVVELRVRKITTLEAAVRYLPEFIAQFNRGKEPRDPDPAWRPAPRQLDLVLSCRYPRTVARDNTVGLGQRLIQIPPGPGGRSYATCRVEVRELLDGRAVVLYQDQRIAELPAPAGPFTLTPRKLRRFAEPVRRPTTADVRKTAQPKAAARRSKPKSRPQRPGSKHPWRRYPPPQPPAPPAG
jgi:transposase